MEIQELKLNHYEIAQDTYENLENDFFNHILREGFSTQIYNHYMGADGGYVNVYRYDQQIGMLRVPGKYVGNIFVPEGYELGDDISQNLTILRICEEYFPGMQGKLWLDGNTGKHFETLELIISANRSFQEYLQFIIGIRRMPLNFGTTADLDEYNVCLVINVVGNICELSNGSKWQTHQNNLCPGDQVRMIDINKLKKVRSGSLIEAEIIDFPVSDANVIEKIEIVEHCGEAQSSVTLKDGSQWLFWSFERQVESSWEVGDRVVLVKPDGFNGSLFNLERGAYGQLAPYTLSAENLPIYVYDRDLAREYHSKQ